MPGFPDLEGRDLVGLLAYLGTPQNVADADLDHDAIYSATAEGAPMKTASPDRKISLTLMATRHQAPLGHAERDRSEHRQVSWKIPLGEYPALAAQE